MADVNLDVVSEGRAEDLAILRVRTMVAGEIDAGTVRDMVDGILARLGSSDKIRRLRIWGHGAPGLACVGNVPRSLSRAAFARIVEQYSLSTICVVERRSRQAGVIVDRPFSLLNADLLAQLTPKFAAGGWVELHCCQVAADTHGEELLKALAGMWRVRVAGSTADQVAGGGFEVDVRVASPGGQVTTRTVAPPPTSGGCSAPW